MEEKYESNEITVVEENLPAATVVENDIEESNYDVTSLEKMAEEAERRMAATNKIMNIALRITTGLDWTMIGGKPYLQESGATKIATIFEIGWDIKRCEHTIDNGYHAFTYTMIFFMKNRRPVEVIGGRSGRDEFFSKGKKPDEIDWQDVKKAAYTNCLNRGIKTILPGLRNIDAATLEAQGIKVASGYSFKAAAKGGKTEEQKNEGLVCSACGAPISQKVASFAESKYGKKLCMDCQKQMSFAAEGRQA